MIMHSQTWLIFLFPIILTNISTLVTSQEPFLQYRCNDQNGNYTRNSTYSNNLNSIFSSIPSNMSPQGFYNASVGRSPDQVNVIALCRGDIQPARCSSCIGNGTVELVNFCPNQRQGILWREHCMLRYSDVSIFGDMADTPVAILRNGNNVTSPQQFKEELRTLFDQLRVQASSGGSLIKVAVGERAAPDFQTIYGLLQCSPDISADECSLCLQTAAQRIPGCCPNTRGIRVYQPSCIIRYESYLYYNLTRIQEAQAAAAPPPISAPSPPTLLPPPPPPSGNGTRTIIIIVVVISVSLITIAACVGIFMFKRRKHKAVERADPDEEMNTGESLQYDFGKISAATNDFSDSCKLGQGGFGAVYKGKLQNGQEIAVKRLSRGSAQGDLEFKNEVILVARLQHRNLVRLLGFAIDGTERLLVYEFVENASLDLFLFDSKKRLHMDWDKRYKIILGIARGLLYLHEDSRLRIIHRDLKAGNILLDAEMTPKIADFGMARLVEMDACEGVTSRIVGTYGYMAPEYAMHGQFSVKSDVFSFGVLVLEIITGQKNNNFRNGENQQEDMLSFAWRNWREGTTTNMIDPVLRASSGSLQDMLRCIHIGLLCVQENVNNRPTMASVVLMLNSSSVTMHVPSQPAFFVPNSFDEDTTSLLRNDKSRGMYVNESSEIKYTDLSKNDISVTELYPR